MDTVDYSLYPSVPLQYKFIAHYLAAVKGKSCLSVVPARVHVA